MKTNTFKIDLRKLLTLFIFFAIYNIHAQTPDLRTCGYGCTSNSFSIQSVFLSATDVPGTPLTNTSCQPGTPQMVYMIAEITSNRNAPVYDARIFADLMVGGSALNINQYLGTLPASNSGITQRLVYGPFNWICGETLTLQNLLVVWRTTNQGGPGANGPYTCNTYSQSQCQFPSDLIVSTPLAVQYDYTACTTGSTSLVTFQSTTIGGTPPYTYVWNYDGGTYQSGTASAPIVLYNIPGTYNPTLKVTDSKGNTNLYPYSETLVFPSQLINTPSSTSPTCTANNGSGSFTASGGTPPYSFTVTTNTTGASTSMNGPPTTVLSYSGAGPGTITVRITDDAGCTATQSINVTSGDTQPPVIAGAISPTTIEGCNVGAAPAAQTTVAGLEGLPGNLTITDNVSADANITVNSSDSVSGTCPIVITRTYTVTDECGNTSSSFTHIINIDDSTPPTIDTDAADSTVECDGSGNAAELAAWLASNGGAAASDTCGGVSWSNDYAALSDDCGATGSATVTFTATDDCGNTSTTSATFTIEDTTDPTIDTPASDSTVECDGSGNAAELAAWLASNGGAAASDTCGGVSWSNDYSALSDDCGATGSATVTFTATDDCGNTSTTSATFTIEDTTDPTIDTVASDSTVECDGSGNAAELAAWLASNGGAAASDTCGGVSWSNDYAALSDDCGATGSATVTFTATDDCGNTSTTSATFTIEDTTDPTIDTVASDSTVECDGSGNAAELAAWLASNGGAAASDTCGGVSWSNDYAALSDDCGATGSATVTFTATDDCGNTSTTSATFTIEDTTDPTIDTPASDSTVECDGSGNAAELAAWLASNGGAAASDTCGGVSWSNDYAALSDDCGATGSATVTFTATDDCGNTSTTSATFTIEDTTDPTIDTPASDSTVECDGSGNAAELAAWLASNGGAAASDTCGGVSWSNDYAALSDDCGATGSATVTFTATDDCGNTSTTSATFTIEDTTDPTIDTVASDSTVECDGSGNAAELAAWLASNGGAAASDTCGGVSWSNDYAALSDDCGATGSATVTFTATDDCGNTSTTSATFTIEDTTDPTIDTVASDSTVECDGSGNAAELAAWLASNGGAAASDTCGGVSWSNDYAALSDDCGATGSATVTFTATDDCGNTSTTSATFTIEDTTDPTIDTPASDSTVECDGSGNAAELAAWLASNGGAAASDTCGGVSWSNDYAALSDDCGATGSATVTFTATDDCGNTSTTSATFTIEDTTDPTIDTPASDSTVECDGSGNAAELAAWLASNGGAAASDTCGGVSWSNDYAALSDDCGATGSATVTFTATDDCGNTSTTSATFTIEDTTDPTIDTPASDSTVECDGSGNAAELAAWLASNGGAAASDTCGGVSWSNDYAALSDDCGATGSATVTFTATDDCGNTSTSSATFTIEDTTDPTIDTPASDSTVECDGSGNAAELAAWLASNGGAAASDTCGGVSWSNDYAALSDDCGATGSATVTFTATDDCGNTSTTSATFTIEDTTDPTIDTVASDSTVECDGSGNAAELAAWLASNGGAAASDTCGGVSWSNDYAALSDDCGATGSATVTFTATDDCGNTSTTSATFTIEDTTDPTIDNTNTVDIEIECGVTDPNALQDWLDSNAGATSSDSCGNVTWTNDYGMDTNVKCDDGAITVTFIATDDCGNSTTTTATYLIKDTIPPTITAPGDVTIECTDDESSASNGVAIGSDDCSAINITESDTETVACGNTKTITRTWTATDACGNTASAVQTITVVDTTPPSITAPADVTIECTSDESSASNGVATGSDTCGTVTITESDVEVAACGNTKTIAETWTATDACGNTASADQIITVVDTTPPSITAPADVTIECTSDESSASNGMATGSDSCGDVTITESDVEVAACGNTKTITRTWTATDACGNTASADQVDNCCGYNASFDHCACRCHHRVYF